MYKQALVFVCFATRSVASGYHSAAPEWSQASGIESDRLFFPLNKFAAFVLATNPATAWQMNSPMLSKAAGINNAKANRVRSQSAFQMNQQREGQNSHSRISLYEDLSPRLDRRKAIASGLVLGSMLLPNPAVPPALAADEFESVVPQATLTAALASAAPRDIVITGCNSGVGLAGAKLLVAAGHRVVCACRTQAKADKAVKEIMEYAASAKGSVRSGGSARGAECDLSSLSSVRAFAKSLEGSKIDTLALNAGFAHGKDDAITRTAEGFEETIGVNHLGHFLLANLLAPKLAASASPRLVVTGSGVHDPTSGGGKVGAPATLGDLVGLESGAGFEMVNGEKFDADKAYKDSKLCNLMFMAEASRRFADKKITVNAFSPGLIPDPKGFFRNQNPVFANIFSTIANTVGVTESNLFGGSALGYLAVDPAVDGVTGKWYDAEPPGKHQLGVHAASEEARRVESQKKLWTLSSKLVGLA